MTNATHMTYPTIDCLTLETVAALRDEAATAGDLRTVADCDRTSEWLRCGGAAIGRRCRAAARVAAVLDAATAAAGLATEDAPGGAFCAALDRTAQLLSPASAEVTS